MTKRKTRYWSWGFCTHTALNRDWDHYRTLYCSGDGDVWISAERNKGQADVWRAVPHLVIGRCIQELSGFSPALLGGE